jgi:ribosomal-protein-alanine N-acetyltransferase
MTMPPIPVLETERLWLKPYALSDATCVQRRFNNWEVVKYLSTQVPWPYPDDGAATFVAMAQANNTTGAKNHWALWIKDGPEEPVGAISLWPDDGKSRDMRGFWLDPEFQGQGYMTEAANRVTDYALIELGWPHLWLNNARDNVRSAAVKERQGAVLVDEEFSDFVCGRLPRQVWRLDREAWIARRGS